MSDTDTARRKERRDSFDIFDALTSPLTLLGGAGFVLGAWGTYEIGLPIYAAIIGLAIGLVLAVFYTVFSALF